MPSEQQTSAAARQALDYEFGPFRLDVARKALYRDGEFQPLTPKAAEILLLLLEEAGRVVTKEQMLERAWPGVVVEEGGIANIISALRKTLDAGFGGEAPIATVARRGYRFTAEVRRDAGSPPPAPSPAAKANAAAAPAKDTILVGDIENKTGDPVFDETIRQALMLHLAQSPFIEVMSDRKVQVFLGYMGKPGAGVVGDVALEICQRSGAKAVICGTMFAIGDDYVIGLQALHGETGDILLVEQARAHGKGEVLKALDLAAIGLRTKLGESLASVQSYFKKFDEVATASLDALKAYTVGRREWWVHGDIAAKRHQLRAIELDPLFGGAYSAASMSCNNMGQTIEARRYMQRAFDLRDRMSERERMRTDANYHDTVTGDLFRGMYALEAWQQSPYAEPNAFGNCGSVAAQLGLWEKALAMARQALDMEPTGIIAGNMAIAQMSLGMMEAARATLADAFSRGWDAFFLHLEAYQEAFLRDDRDSMRRHVEAVIGRAGEEDFLIAAQADTEACHGRFDRARELSERAVASAKRADAPEMAASWQAQAAFREALAGDLARARAGGLAALDLSDGKYVLALAGLTLAMCGEVESAEAASTALAQEHAANTVVQRLWLPCTRAAFAMRNDDWKSALDALEPAASIEYGITLPFEAGFMVPVYLRALALQGAGQPIEARAEFRKIVERPGLIRNFMIYPLAVKAVGAI